jgi:hypothetical protein
VGDQKLPTFSRVTIRPAWLVFAVWSVDFLTPEHKRDIVSLKAARVLRLDEDSAMREGGSLTSG